jgi:hypothetical protein
VARVPNALSEYRGAKTCRQFQSAVIVGARSTPGFFARTGLTLRRGYETENKTCAEHDDDRQAKPMESERSHKTSADLPGELRR